MSGRDHNMARRQALAGAGVAAGALAVTACAGSNGKPAAPTRAPEPGTLAHTSDVPVGSALILDGVALTQPSAGEFLGLSTVCTHAGCAVSKVDGAELICTCHGSTFGLDGSVIKGPAQRPLARTPIAVRGDSIVAG